MNTSNNVNTTNPATVPSNKNVQNVKTPSKKKTEQPKAFWFFILFGAGIAFSAIAYLGSISSNFPWLVLCGGCAVLAEQIGIFLWGYHSHKPQVKVRVEYVYIATPDSHRVHVEPSPDSGNKEAQKMLELIFEDPDLADEPDTENAEVDSEE